MKSPYEILGVTPNATEDQIQNAYRQLVSENKENPEKIDIINEAYDKVILAKRNVEYNPISDGFIDNTSPDESFFPDVRRLIEQGRFLDADEILNGVPQSGRDANGEWHFLKGTVCYNRGMIDSAASHFKQASIIEPNNKEFYEAMMMTQNSQTNASYGGFLHFLHKRLLYTACMYKLYITMLL